MTTKRKKQLPTVPIDRKASSGTLEPADGDPALSPDHRLQQEENEKRIRDALAALPDEFRTSLVMKEIDGLSYEQIAEALEIPLGTVRSRIFRARRELAEFLKREQP